LYHFMDKYVEKLREQSIGGVIKYIKLGMLTEAKIPLPLINEQKRIASILDKADSIRRKRQEAIAMADEFLRSVFLDMFGDPVTNPKGWRIASLNEVSIIKGEYGSGSSAVSYADGDYRYIRITDITERGDLKEEKVGLSNSDTDGVKYQLKNGDLLFARTGATVGKTFLYEERYGKCAFAGYLIRFRFDEKQVLPEYIKAFTETGIYWDWIQSCQKIVAQPNINAKQYGEDLKIPIPPVNNQKEFIAVWKKIKSMKTQGDSFNREALLESLSQKAFSGDL
jgi:type I restriction enzyme S subunit